MKKIPKVQFQTPIFDRTHPDYQGYTLREKQCGLVTQYPLGLSDPDTESLIEEIREFLDII